MTMSSLKREDMEQAFKNVTIINFNYDRTLEHFLYSALQSDYDLSEPEARKALATFKVIRPYGVIGGLEWQEDGRLPFGEKLHQDHERLFSLAKGIRTYTEQITGELLQQIQPTMERARLVIFLGFGYHQQNMNLLRAKSAEAWRRAFGTVKGIEPENYETMEEAIAQITGLLSHKPKLLPWDAQKLLMDMRPALMAAAGM
jgi:hypothetical protein